MSSERKIICKFDHVTKKFPGVTALDRVSFEIAIGEVHAIVGENGAGKSTLMNVLSGVYPPTEGDVYFQDQKVSFQSPHMAQKMGIAMIHQELSLAPHMTVAENVFINRMPKKTSSLIDKGKMAEQCKKYLNDLGVYHIEPNTIVKNLSTSEQQLVEIAKAMSLNAKLVIMDEPTSSLTPTEVEFLIHIIEKLRSQEVAILYISHKLEEVLRISDYITVMRDGRHIKTALKEELDEHKMISLMVGRNFEKAVEREFKSYNKSEFPILSVRHIYDYTGKVKDVSFDLYKGEILGLTGLVGAGRTELLQCIFGANKMKSGEIYIEGKRVQIKECQDAIANGIALIPEGRKTQGLFLKMTVEENMLMVYQQQQTGSLGMLKKKVLRGAAGGQRERLAIKTPSLEQKIINLSGGNQQKVILARWLLNKPKILFMDEPTNGIDVGAKKEIYKIIIELAASGVSVIMVSSEMTEVLSLSDRIMVMHDGMIRGKISHKEATQEKIMEFTLDKLEK